MKLLVTGATGLLGVHLVEAVGRRGVEAAFAGLSSVPPGPSWHRCDLTDETAVSELWSELRPAVVVHAAALTNVDLCERDPELADRVNRGTAERLARHAAADGARLVLISTDSVFDGARGGYTETDEPAPVNVYAATKLAAEQEVAAVEDHLILRTNFFGRSARGHGLAEWLLSQFEAGEEVVGFTDVVFSPLWCGDLASLVLDLVAGSHRGVLHVGSADSVTKFEFARCVASAFRYDTQRIRFGWLADASLEAARPLDTSLNSARTAELLGRSLPVVDASIQAMRFGADHAGALRAKAKRH